MTVMEANQIRIHYYNNTNPTEDRGIKKRDPRNNTDRAVHV